MAVIPAAVTDEAREWWPRLIGLKAGAPGASTITPGDPPAQWDPRIKFFKVGEGGWVNPGGGPEPRTPPESNLKWITSTGYPSPATFTDIDAAVDITRAAAAVTTRYGSTSRATFSKSLSTSDIVFVSPSIIEIECLLDFGEFNDDGFSNSPEIWEIGIFSDHPEFVNASPYPQGGPFPANPLNVGTPGLMVAYGTFPMQTKDATKQILNVVRILF
jgi:hypothetical protein